MKSNNNAVVPEAREALDKFKMEAAAEVGVNLKEGYNGDEDKDLSLEVWRAELPDGTEFRQIFSTGRNVYFGEVREAGAVTDGRLRLHVTPKTAVILGKK